jgi:hypothetical protein
MALHPGVCLFFCVSSFGGSTSLCSLHLGFLPLRSIHSLPFLGSVLVAADADIPRLLLFLCGEETEESPPPSFLFLLKDRLLNLKGFLKENFFFFLEMFLGGTSPLASAP